MNKNIKTMFLFTTLLVLLVGIGCATAVDITDDSTTDTIQKTGTTEPASTGSNVINKASNSKTVTKTATSTNATTITESTYSKYFDNSSVAKSSAFANSKNVKLSGDFKNKDFIFDNIKLNITGTGTLYNASIVTQNGANVVFDGLKISNTNKNAQAVLFESNGNTIKNSTIVVTDNNPLHAIELTGNNNTLSNVTAKIKLPSTDVKYEGMVGTPQTSALYISSNGNIIENSKISLDGSEKAGDFPSADGIDIQSPNGTVTIKNNRITNTTISVTGPFYVYGVNVGRAENTELGNIAINIDSDYYTNGVQLFDANNISISGSINSTAKTEAYGVYSTAMGTGKSNEIILSKLNITVNGNKATGALLEGSANAHILYSKYNIKGNSSSAVNSYVDWMGNEPENITVRGNEFNVDGTDNTPVLYFGLCNQVTITGNAIASTKGSQIYFNKTTNGSVTNNYISIANKYIGDDGANSTEKDSIIKNNHNAYILTDDNYSNFFDSKSVLKPSVTNGSMLIAKGDFKNKDFVFDNVIIIFETFDNTTFYNASFVSQNNAMALIDEINIENKNKNTYAVLFESETNILINSNIKIVDNKPLHGVELTCANNLIINSVINVTAPSADVVYESMVGMPQTSAVLLSSNNSRIQNSKIYLDGSQKTGDFPSADGIDIQSPSSNITINNNIITNTEVTVKGPSYVYGVNVGRAKNTTLTNVTVKVDSDYYSNGVQLFDADGMSITGVINSSAKAEAYGVYSTAMGTGASKDINLTDLNITVNAPKAIGALMEGSSNIVVANSNINITGNSTTGVSAYVDWMGNKPDNVNITNNIITLNGKADNSVLYFGLSNNIVVDKNNITSTKGSEINFNKSTNGKVTNNFIKIDSGNIYGDNAVKTTEKDTVVNNNTPKVTFIKFDKISNVAYSNNVTISGKFADNTGKALPNTKLKLNINGKTVTVKTAKDGSFKYTTKATTMGTNNVTASYAGNDKYGKVTNKTTFKVVKQGLKIKLDKIGTVSYKDTVTIKGTFTDANGKGIINTLLQVKINKQTVSVKTTTGGAFTYTTKATTMGTNNVTVSYNGNSKYNKVSQKTTFKVVKQSLNIKINKIATVDYKDNVTISGKLTDGNGKAVMNTLVKVKINRDTFTAKTDNKGVFTLKTKATTTGTNNVTVSYDGNTYYSKVSTKATFKVNKKGVIATVSGVKVAKGKVTVTGKFTDSDKKVLMNSLVKVTINGKSGNAKTNNKGVFTYTKSVSGNLKITAGYAGNDNYKAYTSPALIVSVA